MIQPLFGEAAEILDYAQELQKINGRYLQTTVEQSAITQAIIEKAEKLVKDLGLEEKIENETFKDHE